LKRKKLEQGLVLCNGWQGGEADERELVGWV